MAQESWGFWVGTSNRLREAPLKRIVGALLASAVLASSAFASGRQDDITRTRKAAEVFKQIMATPDMGIPEQLLKSASCIAVIPGDTAGWA